MCVKKSVVMGSMREEFSVMTETLLQVMVAIVFANLREGTHVQEEHYFQLMFV